MYNLSMKKIFLYMFLTIFLCGAGYEGTLPDIEADFAYKKKSEKSTAPYGTQEITDKSELKEAPVSNPEYINIILKKEKNGAYFTDIRKIIAILEKLKCYMEDNASVQLFNACVSNYIDNAAYLQTTYEGKPEEYYASYRAVTALAATARDVAVLKTESLMYTKYLPYSAEGAAYSPEKIKEAEDALLKQLYDTLYVLKNLE